MLACNSTEDHGVVVPVPGAWLQGRHRRPPEARGLVLIGFGADGNPQGRVGKNLAKDLNDGGLATLLVDLLDGEERTDPHTHSDSNLLTERWITISRWLRQSSPYAGWNVGLYACGIPAAGALMAAARQPEDVQAVVTHNGRADLAENWLPLVEAPTLLLVDRGEEDLVEVNRRAVGHLDTTWKMVEVENSAGEQPSRVAGPASRLARTWFLKNLRTRSFLEREECLEDWMGPEGSDGGGLS